MEKKHKKTQIGVVLSNKMEKTAVVEVARRVSHPVFKRYFTKRKKFKVHDEKNECVIGVRVQIQECRPVSREKRWTVTKIIEKAA